MRKLAWFAVFFAAAALLILPLPAETKTWLWALPLICCAVFGLTFLLPGKEKPLIYMACGTSDSLLESNRKFKDKLIKNGFDVTYIEEPGAHEWDFWDRQIKAVIDWLPLGKNNNGLNSGNVGIDK